MSGAKLRASPRLALFLLCAHAAAAAAAWAALGGAAGSAIALLVLTAGGCAIHGHALLLASDSPAYVELSPSGELRIIDRSGLDWSPIADSACHVSRWAVIVPVAGKAGQRRRLLVAGDMLAREPFRRLRIWALWGPPANSLRRAPGRGSSAN